MGSSMLAMILTSPPNSLQVSIPISKTRFNRIAQVIETRCARVFSTHSGPDRCGSMTDVSWILPAS